MEHSLQKASFVKSRAANRGRLWGFDELYQGSRPAKRKEWLAQPPSGGSCHDCWVYPVISGPALPFPHVHEERVPRAAHAEQEPAPCAQGVGSQPLRGLV